MAKFQASVVPDAMLAKIATATRMTICSAQPANFAGIAAVILASATIVAGTGNGDWTIAAGDAGGGTRKVTKSAETGLSITGAGTQNATHVCFDDGTTLLYGTTCTSQALTNGGTVSTPAFKIEIGDPV